MNEDSSQQLIQTTLENAAKDAGIVDTSLLSIVELPALTLNEKGQVPGVKEFIDWLKKAKPQYFIDTNVRNLSDADYAAAKKKLLAGKR